ncbi:hypothetical protein [Rhizobium mongolense]|uniref:TRAP-type uncharacterized transport system substrate-binding protein n=1 Tax=Rhizobium mongolense TaxID=57676 RepID=A0A7W6RUR1_9HYPH|nr:hypothetical protein [Rhizobium mongolense]MBB4279012.1 TRAP-type uncharacterized transport system substrate-binding protein [Rhizobium mongolense]
MFNVAGSHETQRNELKDIVLAGGALGFYWLPVHLDLCAGIFEASGLRVSLKRTGSAEKATAAVKAGEADLATTARGLDASNRGLAATTFDESFIEAKIAA